MINDEAVTFVQHNGVDADTNESASRRHEKRKTLKSHLKATCIALIPPTLWWEAPNQAMKRSLDPEVHDRKGRYRIVLSIGAAYR
jgi:hypothetical protein